MADANDPRLVGETLEPTAVCQAPRGEKSFCTRSLPCEYPTPLPDHLARRVAGEHEQRAVHKIAGMFAHRVEASSLTSALSPGVLHSRE